MPDSTYTKRPAIKKDVMPTRVKPTLMPLPVVPKAVRDVFGDMAAGVVELKRQSGAAVENIKEGVRKIKASVRP